MTHRLLDFDWTVHEIVSSSMCDNHQEFSSKTATTVTSSKSEDESAEVTKTLREPLSKVLRLELMLMKNLSDKSGVSEDTEDQSASAKKKQLLLELSKREVEQLIESLQQALQES
jgi:DUF438 domain-containing protein